MSNKPPYPILDPEVKAAFSNYPEWAQAQLMLIRTLIFDTAKHIDGVGRIKETLKWGEPSYLTPETHSGSTIRLAYHQKRPYQIGIYFNCKATLVEQFRLIFHENLNFEGNRAIVFKKHQPLPLEQLSECIEMALTYHLEKRKT